MLASRLAAGLLLSAVEVLAVTGVASGTASAAMVSVTFSIVYR